AQLEKVGAHVIELHSERGAHIQVHVHATTANECNTVIRPVSNGSLGKAKVLQADQGMDPWFETAVTAKRKVWPASHENCLSVRYLLCRTRAEAGSGIRLD